MYFFVKLRIGRGIVAENSSVWRSAGRFFMISSMSSTKPMSSISSASSITRNLIVSSLIVARRIWSSNLPGVPITIWTPLRKALICRSIGWPP